MACILYQKREMSMRRKFAWGNYSNHALISIYGDLDKLNYVKDHECYTDCIVSQLNASGYLSILFANKL